MAKFPVFYKPRPYQAELHEMWRDNRVGIAVLPRQSGKDVACSMSMAERRLRTPKTTGVYVSLNNPMIRDILWDKTYQDPITGEHHRMLQDNVPPSLVTWRNTSMTGNFTNGSKMKLQGYFQSGQDANGVGTSFQDYAFTELALFSREDPMPRLMPIIMNESENKKLMVVSTPRGMRKNPLWQLMESMKGADDYKLIVRDIDQLNAIMREHGQAPVLTERQLEAIKDKYLKRFGNSRMFEQEYYVSFEETDAAAVYGEALMKLISEGRNDDFNINSSHPIYVVFDIGSAGKHSDATSWLAFQWINGKLFLYDCGEGHGKALPEYVDDLRLKPWFSQLKTIILPWDSEHHVAAIRQTPADMVRLKFQSVTVLRKSSNVYKTSGSISDSEITDIQQTRMALYNTVIHKTNCDWVLECIENYKYEYNNKLDEWSATPLHDKYSHMMDALRYAVQATREVDFFGTSFTGGDSKSRDYVQDYTGVWN